MNLHTVIVELVHVSGATHRIAYVTLSDDIMDIYQKAQEYALDNVKDTHPPEATDDWKVKDAYMVDHTHVNLYSNDENY